MRSEVDRSPDVHRIIAATGARDARRIGRIQSLWSGWGEIARYALVDGPASTVIVKVVQPPERSAKGAHPRGWDSDVGEARKRRSYEVESAFYQDWASWCGARIARGWSIESGHLVLEDLDGAGFAGRAVGSGSLDDLRIGWCIDWLADLHRGYLGMEPTGLWETGTYWHLATRPDEWAAMASGPLKSRAADLDAALAAAPATVVHGDAKVANFCFGASGVAGVDFQYTGGGCGLKDVAYFLGSCLDDAALYASADRWLDRYFARLDSAEVERAWREVWPHAWADFERFLAGWAPGHWKRGGFAAEMTATAIERLSRR